MLFDGNMYIVAYLCVFCEVAQRKHTVSFRMHAGKMTLRNISNTTFIFIVRNKFYPFELNSWKYFGQRRREFHLIMETPVKFTFEKKFRTEKRPFIYSDQYVAQHLAIWSFGRMVVANWTSSAMQNASVHRNNLFNLQQNGELLPYWHLSRISVKIASERRKVVSSIHLREQRNTQKFEQIKMVRSCVFTDSTNWFYDVFMLVDASPYRVLINGLNKHRFYLHSRREFYVLQTREKERRAQKVGKRDGARESEDGILKLNHLMTTRRQPRKKHTPYFLFKSYASTYSVELKLVKTQHDCNSISIPFIHQSAYHTVDYCHRWNMVRCSEHR